MGLIRELEKIMDGAENEYRRLKDRPPEPGLQKEISCPGKGGKPQDHRIIHCDNLSFLAQGINSGQLREAFDLIYCDPPFFTKTKQEASVEVLVPEDGGTLRKERLRQRAYSDLWNRDASGYLKMLGVRLFFLRDALKDTGSIFVHLDWHAVHGVKLMMDEIFGEDNFVNEIIWTYKSGGAAKRHYARKHDTILFYGKTQQYKFHETEKEKSYNRGLKPYHFKGVEEFQDEVGWYTLVNPRDVWQMDMLGRSSAERLRYATQKPEALLSKIIRAVTDPGDLCGDFFCGSGTLGAAAAALGRRSVCVDAGELAVSNAMKRPLMRNTPFELWSCRE
ncbi:MAG: DNA methyltransferase, partial [Anaerovoracaceae bacterium]